MLNDSLIYTWLASIQWAKLATAYFPVNGTLVYEFFTLAKVEDLQQGVWVRGVPKLPGDVLTLRKRKLDSFSWRQMMGSREGRPNSKRKQQYGECSIPPPLLDYFSKMFIHPTPPPPPDSMEEQLQLHFNNLKDWMDVKFEKIVECFDRSDQRMNLLASNVTNLCVDLNSFRVSTAQPTGTASTYTSPASTPIANMMVIPLTPHTDQQSSSSARPSISRRDPHV